MVAVRSPSPRARASVLRREPSRCGWRSSSVAPNLLPGSGAPDSSELRRCHIQVALASPKSAHVPAIDDLTMLGQERLCGRDHVVAVSGSRWCSTLL
jgi:hypothetical protein